MSRTGKALTADDLRSAEEHGISAQDAAEQFRVLTSDPTPVRVIEACSIDHGIEPLEAETHDALLASWRSAAQAGRIAKFVPASGGATRMFQTLARVLPPPPADFDLERVADPADQAAVGELVAGLTKLALWPVARRRLESDGHDVAAWLERRDFAALLRALVFAEEGLAAQPKALIPFHQGPAGDPRTSAEEHLAEAHDIGLDASGRCRLHFTVSPEHRSALLSHLAESPLQELAEFEIEATIQAPATDTLAITPEGEPFRDREGRMLFRPGGHGALLHNLAKLDAEFILVKNIDNVQPHWLRADAVHWQRLMLGRLADLQSTARRLAGDLQHSADSTHREAARAFLADAFSVEIPDDPQRLLDRLRRPIRVCGMVPNTGEPGGGPFWTESREGRSVQIVESAEIAEEAKSLMKAATHFNPVLLALAPRVGGGDRPDLADLVDRSRFFVAEKSFDGRPLKALERPGLWNGAMAGWNSLFVEVPISVFSPVKTINDLLRPEHLAPQRSHPMR